MFVPLTKVCEYFILQNSRYMRQERTTLWIKFQQTNKAWCSPELRYIALKCISLFSKYVLYTVSPLDIWHFLQGAFFYRTLKYSLLPLKKYFRVLQTCSVAPSRIIQYNIQCNLSVCVYRIAVELEATRVMMLFVQKLRILKYNRG